MKKRIKHFVIAIWIFASCFYLAKDNIASDHNLIYPHAPISDVVDNYYGTKIRDPYRWLENPDSSETRAWIEAENKITYEFLEKIPERKNIESRLKRLWNYEGYGIPREESGHYFYRKQEGLKNQPVLYSANSLHDEPKVLLDPNTLSSDGTISLQDFVSSRNAKFVVYALNTAGSDWTELKIRNVQTGQDLPDHLKWIKFNNSSWSIDNNGFYYTRYDEPKQGAELQQLNYHQKLCYHRLGTPQSSDEIVYERPDKKEWRFWGEVTDDGRYLIISIWKSTYPENLIFYQDLHDKNAKVIELINNFDAEYSFLGNEGPILWFKTNLNAPKGRVISIDIRTPDKNKWKEIIPQANDAMDSIALIGNKFIVSYFKDAHSIVKTFDLNGQFIRDVELPGIGSVIGFLGRKSHTETFYGFTSYTTPFTVYRYDLKANEITIFRQPKLNFHPQDYETKQIFYSSKDGTRIPMFITHKKGMKPNKNTPAYLYGYGGFGGAVTPYFDVMKLVWMEMGGIYAVANIRGGGEYGEEWHQAGTKLRKQNVFDDFIGAAEWLIANQYTSTPKLAISGFSNGGLLVGACITQRPDLFGAAIIDVGVMDMLRFHKFTIAWSWVDEYGSSDNPEEFKALYAYSPYHKIKKGISYPPTLITTADHDDRVVPAHSFKFTAALQAAQKGFSPILIRIDTKAGHGFGKPVAKMISEERDHLAFLTAVLRINFRE